MKLNLVASQAVLKGKRDDKHNVFEDLYLHPKQTAMSPEPVRPTRVMSPD